MSGRMLQEVLAEVARKHQGSEVLRSCGCGLRGLARPLPDRGEFEAAYVAHLADEQARAVSAWLGEQREAVAEAIWTDLMWTLDAPAGATSTAYADAALAAIREQIGCEVARGEAGAGPGATGAGSVALGVTGEAAGPSDRRICEREDEK